MDKKEVRVIFDDVRSVKMKQDRDDDTGFAGVISPFVKRMRDETRVIIAVNPCNVQVMREECIYDDDEDEVIDVQKKIVGRERVRISLLEKEKESIVKVTDASLKYVKRYLLTAFFNADIRKGDMLIRDDGATFTVQTLDVLYAEGFSQSGRYRKSGILTQS